MHRIYAAGGTSFGKSCLLLEEKKHSSISCLLIDLAEEIFTFNLYVTVFFLFMLHRYRTEDMEHKDEDIHLAKYPKLVEFEDTFKNPESHVPIKNIVHQAVTKRLRSCNVKKSCLHLFPIIKTLKTYSLKQDLPNDIIAGLTSGVMMIPQGMAFAALSTLPPIVGLYISFFSSVTYFLFGTGRQVSCGCIAVLSLMMATILDKYDHTVAGRAPVLCMNDTLQVSEITFNLSTVVESTPNFSLAINSSNFSTPISSDLSGHHDPAEVERRIEVASGVSLVAGVILVVASRLGLSQIASIMSNSLITGFTVGIAFHVFTSQLKPIFGISVPRYNGAGAVIRTWVSVLGKLPETNIATLLTSVVGMLVLYLVKRFVNDRYKKQLRIPIPIELLVVIAGTLISKFAFLHDNFNVKVVQTVPIGVPAPKFPDLSLSSSYIGDGIVIVVIAYAQTLAMAKSLGLKNQYTVDSNQEMLACGMASVVCGLFSGYIAAASVSRSVVQDGAGGRTQMASLFAAGLVLLVIMVIGPYFYYLPVCILSAIIVVNLQTMFLKLLEIPGEWRKSRYDCAVWVFACVSCVILNADIGLLAGVIFSLSLILLRAMLTPVVEAGQIQTGPSTAELRSLDKYSSARQLENVKIIKIKTPLYFVNADIFTAKVFSKTGIDPIKLKKRMKEIKVGDPSKDTCDKNGVNGSDMTDKMLESTVRVVVLSASGVSFIDLMGVQALQFLINEFTSVGVEVLITSVPESIIPMLKSTWFWAKYGDLLYTSVEAALASLVAVEEVAVEELTDDAADHTETATSA